MDPSLSAPTPTLDISGDDAQSVQGQTNQTGNDHAQLTLEQAVQVFMQERAHSQELHNRVAQIEQSGATTTAPSQQNFNYKPSAPEKFTGVATKLETWIEEVELHMDLYRIPRTDGIYRLAVARQFLGDQPSQWARLQGEISGWTELKERMRIYYEVPSKNKNSRDSLYRLRQIGSVKVYTLRFNSLILQIDSMSEEEQRFIYVRVLKPSVKMEIEKEWVRDSDIDLTRMKQLADRKDTLFFNNRGGRTVESNLGAPQTNLGPHR
jgi:replicative superfamily II helicase